MTHPGEYPVEATLLEAADAAALARDPAALSEAIRRIGQWLWDGGQDGFDEIHSRWLRVRRVFNQLDLSIWEGAPHGIEELAMLLARLSYYRQSDRSVDERAEVLERVRALLSPRHYLGRARVDLERAELASTRGTPEDVEQALLLCDDALACVEQLDDERERAHALMGRAHVLARGSRADEGLETAAEARAIYEKHAMTHSLANVTLFIAEVYVARDRIPEASVLSAEAIEGYRRVRDSIGEGNALMVRAHSWRARGKVPRALEDCDRAVVLFELARLRTSQGRSMLYRAGLHTAASRFAEAEQDLEAAVRYLRECPESYYLAAALLQLAAARRRRGDVEGMAGTLDEVETALAAIRRPGERMWALLEVCRICKEAPIPDRPRMRRCSAQALALARAARDAMGEQAALAFASFAG